MRNSDVNDFSSLLTSVYQLYGKDINQGLFELWWNALQRFDIADIRKALSSHVTNTDNGQFLPKPADIIRALEGTTQTKGLTAWSKVEKAIRSVGAYQSIVFDEPAIMASIRDMGGWVQLCQVSEKEMPFKAQEFAKRHAGYVAKPPSDFPSHLIGLSEAENSRNGFQDFTPKPVMIGNQQAAKLVHERGSEAQQGMIHRPERAVADTVKQLTFEQREDTKQKLLPALKSQVMVSKAIEQNLLPENVTPFRPNPKRRAELEAEIKAEIKKLDEQETEGAA